MNNISWKLLNYGMNSYKDVSLRLVVNDKIYFFLERSNEVLSYKVYDFLKEAVVGISEDEAKEYSDYKHLVKIKLKYESILYQELLK